MWKKKWTCIILTIVLSISVSVLGSRKFKDRYMTIAFDLKVEEPVTYRILWKDRDNFTLKHSITTKNRGVESLRKLSIKSTAQESDKSKFKL